MVFAVSPRAFLADPVKVRSRQWNVLYVCY